MTQKVHKVLIVDDSAVFRALLSEIIDSDPQLEVVGSAVDPYEAREKIKKLKPDVITLDIEMPKMDGVQFLRNLMRLHPMPVVMISTLTQHGADATLAALDIGAVDYFPKPTENVASEMGNYRQLVVEKVKMAANANIAGAVHRSPKEISVSGRQFKSDYDVIAIGASTGGTEAIRNVLEALPEMMPPIVVTQHIKAVFSKSFAERLNRASKLHVEELSTDRAPLVSGRVYVAPGDLHIRIVKRGGQYYCERCDGEPVHRHKPSVDVMFSSLAKAAGGRCFSILLTGMGKDGAQGMLDVLNAGGVTVAQDEKSSVVWGMPRAAVEMEAAQHVMPLDKIATYLVGKVYG
ncbi:protein-glutamate methylesterase/protein-glutamine glutaminase [Enterovibrio coralii]|uniref:Protein-glutamate methylesterase/protein-glutamine glutaminase n=1 Tax=Enterovibrio coralii TaxID=294935 RepID=A0A135I3U5_9GAMM|nr:chemotaxis response regulator protein-glutamate methylesterase [Enterovibrio coralii]KXF80120.1 chemotaxis response regulator protein-glutamate methylesterase [Enterovibrio coralii]